MKTLIKTLDIQNASLTVITAGRRLPLAQFTGKIEITEHQSMTPVLGRMCKGEKKIYASFILCQDIEYQTDDEFHTGKVYEAVGDVQGERSCERLIFSGLRFEDMDPSDGTDPENAWNVKLQILPVRNGMVVFLYQKTQSCTGATT